MAKTKIGGRGDEKKYYLCTYSQTKSSKETDIDKKTEKSTTLNATFS